MTHCPQGIVGSSDYVKHVNSPDALSQTINLYETAQVKNANGDSVTWFKGGVNLGRPVVKNKNSEVEVSRATLGDGGLYMFRPTGADFEQVSRLIVRACEDGKYGHECAEICPPCLNGGVCHDITGVCICPPGFSGQHCESSCKPYHFGQNCNHNCTEVQSLAEGSDPKCAGLLFCLPDPYGCSCYPGFYGIDCTTPCKKGAYGANCKLRRTCHCQLDEGCNQHSGVCSKRTCKEGYRDEPYCDKLYPVLHSFSAVALTEYSIEAEWSPWSSKVDRGEGEPDGYIIQFKELDRVEWNRTDLIPDPGNGTLSYVITGLKPNTDYQVQVLVHDTSGHVHSQTAHTERKKTRCGVPGPPSQVYQEGRQETTVVVAWKEPRLSNGVIHGYKVTLVNLNSPAAENVSKVGPEARKVQFDGLEAGTAYVAEVSARTSAGYGKPVNITVYTRPRVPVIETKAELKSVSETAITLQLAALGDQPDDIEAYYVLVQRHDDRKNRTRRSAGDSSEASVGDSALYEWTGGTPDYNESVAMNLSFYMAAKLTPDEVKSQGEFTVGDGRYYGGYYNAPLIPEATYSVGLAAEVNFQGDTRISYQLLTEPITVPGPPSQVYQEGRQETAVVVAWKEPRLSNGVIHGYKVTLVNLNSPAAENVSKVGPEARKVQFDGLEAGTAYVAEVSARTSAGYGKPVNITVYTRPRGEKSYFLPACIF
ncbi:tyrosine-protein phosphatase Lar-like [Haemaphysalis longicornis]